MRIESLTNLIELFGDLAYFKSDVFAYLYKNKCKFIIDDWFGTQRKWSLSEFYTSVDYLVVELSMVC
jgi:hypothetical protein